MVNKELVSLILQSVHVERHYLLNQSLCARATQQHSYAVFILLVDGIGHHSLPVFSYVASICLSVCALSIESVCKLCFLFMQFLMIVPIDSIAHSFSIFIMQNCAWDFHLAWLRILAYFLYGLFDTNLALSYSILSVLLVQLKFSTWPTESLHPLLGFI